MIACASVCRWWLVELHQSFQDIYKGLRRLGGFFGFLQARINVCTSSVKETLVNNVCIATIFCRKALNVKEKSKMKHIKIIGFRCLSQGLS